ncbi:MAG: EF2563 family selenium-dependent molybdenum hydroxylase system protein [Chloroflexi bacterium]|nr:EF2563 family selenium-dependent molybdenum hydroxylase system protein [Chloroflexota bacterium]
MIRGGGDLATGIAARLKRSGFDVVVTEIEKPRALRRLVSLAQAIYTGEVQVEDLLGKFVENFDSVRPVLDSGAIPVLIDSDAASRNLLMPEAIVDARMLKTPSELGRDAAPFVIGLGPGFEAGVDCHVVIETKRGHHLGRVLNQGKAAADTAKPDAIAGFDVERVLRAPASGKIASRVELGAILKIGAVVATVAGDEIHTAFDGVLRGLMQDGLMVSQGEKVGDLDPRMNVAYCYEISDKALAVGGGVMEALLSQPSIRRMLGGANAFG